MTGAALYGPFVLRGDTELAGLRIFATQWEFNAGAFALLRHQLGDALARPVAAMAIIGITGLIAAAHLRRNRQRSDRAVYPALVLTLLGALWLLPAVNPWYLLWLLPLAAASRPSPALWLASAALPLAYIHGETVPDSSWAPFDVPVVLRVIEHSLLTWRILAACSQRPR